MWEEALFGLLGMGDLSVVAWQAEAKAGVGGGHCGGQQVRRRDQGRGRMERGSFEVAEELSQVIQVHSWFTETPPHPESLQEKQPRCCWVSHGGEGAACVHTAQS